MALTLFEAAKRSQNRIARGIFLAIATSDQMLAKLRMERFPGESLHWVREATLSEPDFVSPTHTSIAEGTGTDDRVVMPLRILAGDADTYLFVEEQMSELESAMARQLRGKLKGTGRKIATKAINGGYTTSATLSPTIAGVTFTAVSPGADSDRHGPGSLLFDFDGGGSNFYYRAPGDRAYGAATPQPGANGTIIVYSENPSRWIKLTLVVGSLPGADAEVHVRYASTTHEPDGLFKLIPDSQVVTAAGTDGDAFTFDKLDELIEEKVKTTDDLAFVMNAKLLRKFAQQARAMGGAGIDTITLPGIVAPVPAYRGIPLLKNDNIPSTETKGAKSNLSSIVLVDFGEQGFFAGVGGAGEGALAELTPTAVRIMGLRVRNIGELEAKEAMRQRVTWYGAFGLRSTLAAARSSQLRTD